MNFMLFSNPRQYSSYNNSSNNNNNINNNNVVKKNAIMSMSNTFTNKIHTINNTTPSPTYSRVVTSKELSRVINSSSSNNDDKPKKKPMKWGEPTWFLFHTLAEKVKDASFPAIRKELLNIIYTICVNLPCPMCAQHATEYMNKINFNTIVSKEQLKEVLFTFHNSVNQRKNVALFPHDQLESKYQTANTVSIIQNFMIHFKDKHSSVRMIANDMHRQRISVNLMQWFNNNISHFNA